jgi:hypothetical protein
VGRERGVVELRDCGRGERDGEELEEAEPGEEGERKVRSDWVDVRREGVRKRRNA